MKNGAGYLAIDLVCGMEVNPAEATGTAQFEGATYHFCSGACRAKFVRDPAAFVRPAESGAGKRLAKAPICGMLVDSGVNDAPALATAGIGIAIGSGSDVAKETGGIILVKNDVRDVVTGIRQSAATMRTIKRNLFWAFACNGVGLPIAAFGLLNPIIAAAAMALSSLSVIVNSALLKRARL